jgi:diadenosine tetraphosphate (Ap4A) HIT family hydrolase
MRKGGLTDYRVVMNCGEQAGQSIFHIHLQLLGGWPIDCLPGSRIGYNRLDVYYWHSATRRVGNLN